MTKLEYKIFRDFQGVQLVIMIGRDAYCFIIVKLIPLWLLLQVSEPEHSPWFVHQKRRPHVLHRRWRSLSAPCTVTRLLMVLGLYKPSSLMLDSNNNGKSYLTAFLSISTICALLVVNLVAFNTTVLRVSTIKEKVREFHYWSGKSENWTKSENFVHSCNFIWTAQKSQQCIGRWGAKAIPAKYCWSFGQWKIYL